MWSNVTHPTVCHWSSCMVSDFQWLLSHCRSLKTPLRRNVASRKIFHLCRIINTTSSITVEDTAWERELQSRTAIWKLRPNQSSDKWLKRAAESGIKPDVSNYKCRWLSSSLESSPETQSYVETQVGQEFGLQYWFSGHGLWQNALDNMWTSSAWLERNARPIVFYRRKSFAVLRQRWD